MALAVFDVSFKGLLKSGATADDHYVAEAVVGIDTVLTASAQELYGRIVDPEIDIRRAPGSDLFEVDFGFGINLGMARRAALAQDEHLMNPQPMLVVDALGLRPRDLADPLPGDDEDGDEAGLFQLLLALGGREINRVNLLGDVVDVSCGDDVYHVSYCTYRLLRNRAVRRSIAALADSLKNKDLQRIVFTSRATGEVILELDSRHIVALSMPAEHDALLVDEVRTLQIKMCDEHFSSLVDNGVFSLYPGDILIANVRITTTQTMKGLVSEYAVLKVVDMRWPNRHIALAGA